MEELGGKLRDLREDRGLSLRKVADETGFSPSFLSRLETGKSSITIRNLMKLLSFYGETLADIFSEPVTRKLVYRREERKTMSSSEEVTLELFVDDKSAVMEPILATFEPGAKYSETIEHGGVEFALVLEGECRFEIEDISYVLRQGDCAYFPGDRPHGWHNLLDSPSRVLMIITPPSV
jgi:transcriptional regulator with XRE-family HTH domain